MSKWIYFLFFIISITARAELNCYDSMPFKANFNFFEVRSNQPVSVNSYYKNNIIRIYTNLIEYAPDTNFQYPDRKRPFMFVHLSDEEFSKMIEDFAIDERSNDKKDLHADFPQNEYRMYVNYSLNEQCQKDIIFIRSYNYADILLMHLITHEMFHILRQQMCGSSCIMQLWFEEGLADYVASKLNSTKPNLAIADFREIKSGISFFESDPTKFTTAHYGQSYLFLDMMFRKDTNSPLLKDFLKEGVLKGSTTCELLRTYFNVTLYGDVHLDDLPCETWRIYAYKEFVYSLIDANVSRGGSVVDSIGKFQDAGILAANYSFAMVDVTKKIKQGYKILFQANEKVDFEFWVKTPKGNTFFIAYEDLENFIKSTDSVNIKLLVFNFFQKDVAYRLDYSLDEPMGPFTENLK